MTALKPRSVFLKNCYRNNIKENMPKKKCFFNPLIGFFLERQSRISDWDIKKIRMVKVKKLMGKYFFCAWGLIYFETTVDIKFILC